MSWTRTSDKSYKKRATGNTDVFTGKGLASLTIVCASMQKDTEHKVDCTSKGFVTSLANLARRALNECYALENIILEISLWENR